MKTTLAALAFIILLAVLLVWGYPAHAAESLAAGVAAIPTRLDFTPLIPVVNTLITAVAGILTAATPVVAWYIVVWLRNHGIAASQGAQKVISDRIGATIQNGLKFASAGADAGVSKLNITVDDPTVAMAANYAIAQSPVLLKQAGIDVTTEAGQQTLVRRIIAENAPPPPNAPPASDVNLKVS